MGGTLVANQPMANLTGLPTLLSISTNVSIVNLAVFLFTTSETRGRDTIRLSGPQSQDRLDGSLSCTQLLAAGRRCPGFCLLYCRLNLNSDFPGRSPAGAKRNWESFLAPVFVHDHRTTTA